MCLKPHLIRDKRGIEVLIPCGKCYECVKSRQKDWTSRLLFESKNNKGLFITLTYAPQHLPKDGVLDKEEYQKFLKRLRKNLGPGRNIRYFGIGEYGDERGRPHYHFIMFGISFNDFWQIKKSWRFGYIKLESISYENIKYVSNYVTLRSKARYKYDLDTGEVFPEFYTMSRRPGIGMLEFMRRGLYYLNKFINNDKVKIYGQDVKVPYSIIKICKSKEYGVISDMAGSTASINIPIYLRLNNKIPVGFRRLDIREVFTDISKNISKITTRLRFFNHSKKIDRAWETVPSIEEIKEYFKYMPDFIYTYDRKNRHYLIDKLNFVNMLLIFKEKYGKYL